jgi:hypothetical protein
MACCWTCLKSGTVCLVVCMRLRSADTTFGWQRASDSETQPCSASSEFTTRVTHALKRLWILYIISRWHSLQVYAAADDEQRQIRSAQDIIRVFLPATSELWTSSNGRRQFLKLRALQRAANLMLAWSWRRGTGFVLLRAGGVGAAP